MYTNKSIYLHCAPLPPFAFRSARLSLSSSAVRAVSVTAAAVVLARGAGAPLPPAACAFAHHVLVHREMRALLLSAAALAVPAASLFGVDVSEPVSASSADCLAKAGITFGIARAWHSDDSGYDEGATKTLKAFAATSPPIAGDVYMFPCVKQRARSALAPLATPQLDKSSSSARLQP